jgi:hypothetical protein
MRCKTALFALLIAVGAFFGMSTVPSHAASLDELPLRPVALQDQPPLTDLPPTGRSPTGAGKPSPAAAGLPALIDFIASVRSNGPEAVTGVYVPGLFGLRVVAQPANRPTYVSSQFGVATLYCGLGPCKSIGLLAHNYLSGVLFPLLSPGQDVIIVRGDGSTAHYRVSSIRAFRALSPDSPYSSYVDLNANGGTLSSGELFQQVYGTGNQIVFQTCIANEGNPSWGRLFVIADPA